MTEHAPARTDRDPHTGRPPTRENTDNSGLSLSRRRDVVENDEYAAFAAASCTPTPAGSPPATSTPSGRWSLSPAWSRPRSKTPSSDCTGSATQGPRSAIGWYQPPSRKAAVGSARLIRSIRAFIAFPRKPTKVRAIRSFHEVKRDLRCGTDFNYARNAQMLRNI